jgi:hypothetical protein
MGAMTIDKILHDASTVLDAALRHSSELSEVSTIENKIHHMRVLISRVAAHSYTTIEKNANIKAEVHELQSMKESILSIAKQRFGSSSTVLDEFHAIT